MYTTILKCSGLIGCCIFLLSCSPSVKSPNELSAGIVSFENTSHDFGVISNDTTVVYKFKLTNTGTESLYIKEVKAACGCTSPDWTKEAIAPGDTGFVEAKFSSNKGGTGPFNKYLSLFSNTKDSITGLFISGSIVEKKRTIAELYPETSGNLLFESRTVLLGSVYEKDVIKKIIKVYNNSDKPIRLLELKNLPAYITFSNASVLFKPKAETELELILTPKKRKELGNLVERIELLTDDGKDESKYLFVSATILESFEEADFESPPHLVVEKNIVSFETIKKGNKVSKSITLKNTGAKALKIRKIEPSCTCVSAKTANTTVLPNEEVKLAISYDSKESALGPDVKTILLYTNDPAQAVYTLSINVNIIK